MLLKMLRDGERTVILCTGRKREPVAINKIEKEDGTVEYERNNIPMHKIWELSGSKWRHSIINGLTKSIGVSNFQRNFNAQLLWANLRDMLTYVRHKSL